MEWMSLHITDPYAKVAQTFTWFWHSHLDGGWLGSMSAFLLWPNDPGIKPKLHSQSCFYIGIIGDPFQKN